MPKGFENPLKCPLIVYEDGQPKEYAVRVTHRDSCPQIFTRSPSDIKRDLEDNEILRLEGIQPYFEGRDHVEALFILQQLIHEVKIDSASAVLVNVDCHDDLISGGIMPPVVINFGTWIMWAQMLHLITRNVYWIGRRLSINGLPRRIPEVPYTDVSLTVADFDFIDDGGSEDIFDELMRLRNNGFQLITSIDADAGRGRFADVEYDRNLAETPWLRNLCRKSSAVMIFQSPGFSDPVFALEQTKLFRTLHLRGYQ